MFNLLFVLAVQTKENGFYGTIYALTLHDCSNGFDHMVNPIRVFTCPLGYILSIHVALLICKARTFSKIAKRLNGDVLTETMPFNRRHFIIMH